MKLHGSTFADAWINQGQSVKPMFQAVDQMLNASDLSESELCQVLFSANEEYDKAHHFNPHKSTLDSLFDALTVCEYVMTTRFTNNSPNQVKMILVCMELYLKAAVMKLDHWVDPDMITDSEIHILEEEVPRILNHLREIHL